jgi:hypothetical protein
VPFSASLTHSNSVPPGRTTPTSICGSLASSPKRYDPSYTGGAHHATINHFPAALPLNVHHEENVRTVRVYHRKRDARQMCNACLNRASHFRLVLRASIQQDVMFTAGSRQTRLCTKAHLMRLSDGVHGADSRCDIDMPGAHV